MEHSSFQDLQLKFQVYSKKFIQVNLLTKLRFTLKTVKYYFEVLLHLKPKSYDFLIFVQKYSAIVTKELFLCTIFVRKYRLKKNESQFF